MKDRKCFENLETPPEPSSRWLGCRGRGPEGGVPRDRAQGLRQEAPGSCSHPSGTQRWGLTNRMMQAPKDRVPVNSQHKIPVKSTS